MSDPGDPNPYPLPPGDITDPAVAATLDANDPLAHHRDTFVIDDPDVIYLDGNSLGRLPKATPGHAADLIDRQWGQRLIAGWNEHWWALPTDTGDRIAPLLGANPGEVVVADSTSVNLFKLAAAACKLQQASDPRRAVLLTDDLNFPSDHHILQSVADFSPDRSVETLHSPDHIQGPTNALIHRLAQRDVAVLSLSHVAYHSGFRYDLPRLCAAARDAGTLTLWDLSHAAGAVPVGLNDARADLAVGCTYKYLNGGPGAPAFLFVRHTLQHALVQHLPLRGWIGGDDPFAFRATHDPAPGMQGFLTGTPCVASLALIAPGITPLLDAGLDALHGKSIALSTYFLRLADAWLMPLGCTLASPADPTHRGSHICLAHPDARRVVQTLTRSLRVVPDFRPPDGLRFGFAPLYNTFAEVREAARRTRVALSEPAIDADAIRPAGVVT